MSSNRTFALPQNHPSIRRSTAAAQAQAPTQPAHQHLRMEDYAPDASPSTSWISAVTRQASRMIDANARSIKICGYCWAMVIPINRVEINQFMANLEAGTSHYYTFGDGWEGSWEISMVDDDDYSSIEEYMESPDMLTGLLYSLLHMLLLPNPTLDPSDREEDGDIHTAFRLWEDHDEAGDHLRALLTSLALDRRTRIFQLGFDEGDIVLSVYTTDDDRLNTVRIRPEGLMSNDAASVLHNLHRAAMAAKEHMELFEGAASELDDADFSDANIDLDHLDDLCAAFDYEHVQGEVEDALDTSVHARF